MAALLCECLYFASIWWYSQHLSFYRRLFIISVTASCMLSSILFYHHYWISLKSHTDCSPTFTHDRFRPCGKETLWHVLNTEAHSHLPSNLSSSKCPKNRCKGERRVAGRSHGVFHSFWKVMMEKGHVEW